MANDGPDNEQARAKRQRSRSVAIAFALGAMAILFYVATIVRLGPNAIRGNDFDPPAPAVSPQDVEACKKAGTC